MACLVWGEPYTSWFLERHPPSLLLPNNLPAWNVTKRAYVYVAAEEGREIASHPSFQALAEHCASIEVLDVGSLAELSKLNIHGLMAACQRLTVKRAWESDAGLVWIYPDTVFSNGSFATVARHAALGKRAVVAFGICVEARSREALSPPPEARAMVRASLDCLHPMMHHITWGSPSFTTYPSSIFWNGAGLVLRCWHLQPIFVHARRCHPEFQWTLDGDFLEQAVDFDDCGFVDDSDEFLLIELAGHNKKPPRQVMPPTVDNVARWAQRWTTPVHPRFVCHPFVFHSGDAGVLAPLVEESRAIIDEILSRLHAPA
ncbi:MAG: hypothetical protein FJX60_22735 [Alphaproteobacteria bacterium]|nr:hypothetical protein [Alphaproteobacteria bacterium]